MSCHLVLGMQLTGLEDSARRPPWMEGSQNDHQQASHLLPSSVAHLQSLHAKVIVCTLPGPLSYCGKLAGVAVALCDLRSDVPPCSPGALLSVMLG